MSLPRLFGTGFWNPATDAILAGQFGLPGDINFFGQSFGVNKDELCVLRPSTSELICNNQFAERRRALSPLVDTVVTPNGAVISNTTPSFPRTPGTSGPVDPGNGGGGVGGVLQCDTTEDFVDGGGGKLWKPESDVSDCPRCGKPVVILPGNLRNATFDGVYGSDGERVTGAIAEKMLPKWRKNPLVGW